MQPVQILQDLDEERVVAEDDIMTESLPSYHDLSPQGELSERLSRSIDHLDQIPRSRLVADLARPDRHWSYGADFAGRWLHALSVASRMEAYRDRDFGISEVVQSLCRFQQPDGLLGKVTDDDTYPCTARGLLGLVEAYATFGYPEALSAATKGSGRLCPAFSPPSHAAHVHGHPRRRALWRGYRP